MSEEIRAKDIVPHKTSFSAGDGFYGDGDTSFFMEALVLLGLIKEDVKNNLTPLSIAKKQIFGYSAPDGITSLNDYTDNIVVEVHKTSLTPVTDFPANFEDSGILIVEKTKRINDDFVYQRLIHLTTRTIYTRTFSANTWSNWSASEIDGYAKCADTFGVYNVNASNLASLNNAELNKIYLINRTASTTTTNFPSDFGTGNAILYTQKSIYDSGANYSLKFQFLIKETGGLWFRMYVSATSVWSSWKHTEYGNVTAMDTFGVYNDNAGNLASLNDAEVNKIYLINRTASTTTTNFPSDFNTGEGTLVTYKSNYTSSWFIKYQVLMKYKPNGGIWFRTYASATNTWSSWFRADASTEITIGQGKMYSTLREGLAEAFRHYNAKVIVYPGEYDLVQEFADVLPTISDHNGCLVGKGMHVVFMAGAHVSAMVEKGDYTDEQFNKIKLYFHPFGFYPDSANLNDDFTIEGLDIRAKHTRYAFHDDYGLSQEPCVHKFVNCKMYFENTNTTAQNNFINAIGGGLGRHTTVIVDGGYYECNIAVGSSIIMSGDPDYAQQPIAYHNTTASDEDSESKIILKDVYFADKGYFRATALGGSSVTSKIYISGCRSYFPPLLQKGSSVPSEAPYFNVEVKASWNNEVAQNGHWELDSDDREATWIPNS